MRLDDGRWDDSGGASGRHPAGLRKGLATRAFTLVELLAVIGIIAMLMALVLGIAGYASHKSDHSRAIADLERIKMALESFRAEYGAYPTNTVPGNSRNLTGQLWVRPQREGRAPFLTMKGWNDPNAAYEILDPWGHEYLYLHRPNSPYADHNNSRFGYDLWSLGPDALSTNDDIVNW